MSEYEQIFIAHFTKLPVLYQQEKDIRAEIGKVLEMLKASFALMSSEEQGKFTERFQAVLEQTAKEELGLTDAIRKLLESNPTEWFDAVKVRDRLMQDGFDFSNYASNPLASIHTVLKRFKRKEVKIRKNAAEVNEYRCASRSNRTRGLLEQLLAERPQYSTGAYIGAVVPGGKLTDVK